jgi:hypothetical protein
MTLLEYLAVGLFYLPFLALPFIMLFWYAFAAKGENEGDRTEKPAADETAQTKK